MSFDLCVLSAKRPLTREEAAEAYSRLADDTNAAVLEADERIGLFLAEITARWPQIDDVPEEDEDECPWSVEFDQSPAHIISCIRWDRAERVYRVYVEMAMRHGLYVYDPQEDELHSPPEDPS